MSERLEHFSYMHQGWAASRDAPVRSDWVPVGLGTGPTGYPVRLGTGPTRYPVPTGTQSDWVTGPTGSP